MRSKAKLTAKQNLVKGLARQQISFKLETVLAQGTVPKIGPAKAGPTRSIPPPMDPQTPIILGGASSRYSSVVDGYGVLIVYYLLCHGGAYNNT